MRSLVLLLAVAAHSLAQPVAVPNLIVAPSAPSAVDPGLAFPVTVSFVNLSSAATLTNGVITVDVPAATGFTDLPEACSHQGTRVFCLAGNLRPDEGRHIQFSAIAPDQSLASISITATLDGIEADAPPSTWNGTRTYRTFFVVNTGDEGAGSLRQALLDADAGCAEDVPCKIAFRIVDVGAIRPRSPLPPLRGLDVAIDGATQARYIGGTNPIEIDGSDAGVNATGIIVEAPCAMRVRGLAIHDFSGDGVLVAGDACASALRYDQPRSVDGDVIERNARGITVRSNDADSPAIDIADNLVSGNRRSGIAVDRASFARITRNLVGLTASHQPQGNGASGIYLGPGAARAEVRDNFIGFNAHAGVSVDRASRAAAVRGNSIQANGSLAIDFGLDGPTTATDVRVPQITNAFYDAASDTTIIEGSVERGALVNVFANDAPDDSGYGEGQYSLGTVIPDDDGTWRFFVPGHAPGAWIAAVAMRISDAATVTSEFSRTVEVH